VIVLSPNAGRLVLPVPPWCLSVAPDGGCLAWFPHNCDPIQGCAGDLRVYINDDAGSVRSVRLEGQFGARLAISSKGEHLAVAIVVAPGPATRLLVLTPGTGKVEQDVTDLITRFRPERIERRRFSAAGDRLVAGSRNLFSVVDLPSRKVIFEGAGRFPSLSHSGEAVAFVDEQRKLNVATLATGATRRLLRWSETYDVGFWTPDGALLLAGVRGPLSFFWYLSAVDCSADASAEITRLEEHDFGQECGLISRRLLTPSHTGS
jgi:hypothetical protein